MIFSDGLTDAQNAEEEEFGDERLIECCKSIPAGIDAKGVAEQCCGPLPIGPLGRNSSTTQRWL